MRDANSRTDRIRGDGRPSQNALPLKILRRPQPPGGAHITAAVSPAGAATDSAIWLLYRRRMAVRQSLRKRGALVLAMNEHAGKCINMRTGNSLTSAEEVGSRHVSGSPTHQNDLFCTARWVCRPSRRRRLGERSFWPLPSRRVMASIDVARCRPLTWHGVGGVEVAGRHRCPSMAQAGTDAHRWRMGSARPGDRIPPA